MSIMMIHPRIESSLSFRPIDIVQTEPPYTEARRTTYAAWSGRTRPASIKILTTLEFLLAYDWRGSNKFQEEENLQFLRMYIDHYPAIMDHFQDVGPTQWDEREAV